MTSFYDRYFDRITEIDEGIVYWKGDKYVAVAHPAPVNADRMAYAAFASDNFTKPFLYPEEFERGMKPHR